MKLLLLSAASSVHTVRWANAFVDRGIVVHLVTQHPHAQGLDARVAMHSLPHLGGAGYLFNGPAFSAIIHRVRPDVVNAHYATGYGNLARSCGGVPLVLNVWGSDVYDFPRKSPLHRWIVRRNLRRADRVVSTSEVMAVRTRSICPDLGRMDVVPFGVDTAMFKPAGRNERHGGIAIGTVKSLAREYGVDILVKAFAQLDDPGSLTLRIVGGGPQEKDPPIELATALGVSDRTEFVGAVPHAHVPEELRKLDVFVALSRSESFGVAVIEASACGLPVVVSDAGGLPEVVADGMTGIVVRRDDPEAAAAAISGLIASPELRTRMGAAGAKWVAGRYEWSICVDHMLRVLQGARDKGTGA